MALFDGINAIQEFDTQTIGARTYEISLAEDLYGGGGTIEPVHNKRGSHKPLGVSTAYVFWVGSDPAILDGSDQSEVPAGELSYIGIISFTT